MSAEKYLLGILTASVLFVGSTFASEGGYPSEAGDTIKKAEAYVVDDRGEIVRNSYNECWRTGYWTPELAIKECDPDLVEPELIAKAPALVTATPPEKLTLSADALFNFDSANLKPNGKVALDKFISDTAGIKYDLIIVIGYTDRIGTNDYNKKLSMHRAQSVKTYLVAHGIDSNRVFADGKGEASPETGDTCKSNSRSWALIDCLAPDRRVEIEVTGIR